MVVVCDGVFRDFSIGGLDRERSGKAIDFDSMFLDKHPIDECSSHTAIDNSSGLQWFIRVYGGKDGCRDP
jgi:hypothetical protein